MGTTMRMRLCTRSNIELVSKSFPSIFLAISQPSSKILFDTVGHPPVSDLWRMMEAGSMASIMLLIWAHLFLNTAYATPNARGSITLSSKFMMRYTFRATEPGWVHIVKTRPASNTHSIGVALAG
ncbi:unnamed protein product [Haemonchus placei]|uniref:Secreted protein n=1 Tax=Haemonchus placei TaxID=6290 RepID=A0A0N4WV90_HAEPC|nr:unnamed protein product [Haemonchus placei]